MFVARQGTAVTGEDCRTETDSVTRIQRPGGVDVKRLPPPRPLKQTRRQHDGGQLVRCMKRRNSFQKTFTSKA